MNTEELQQAVYDQLTGAPAVNGAVVGIYTKAPQQPESEDPNAFPYITLGPVTTTPSDDKDQNAVNALVDVHIWSRSQSALTWRGIGDAVYGAMQLASLTITGANFIESRFENAVDFEDPEDGRTWHYVQTYRILYYLQ